MNYTDSGILDPNIIEEATAAVAKRASAPHASAYDPWPDEVRELVYGTWAFLADRSPLGSLRILKPLVPGLERLSPQAVGKWAKVENWNARADSELANLAPHLHAAVQRKLLLASVTASSYVGDVLAGRAGEEDPRMQANRLRAAFDTLDRTGHPRMAEVATLNVRVTAVQRWTVEQLAEMSADQLAAIASGETIEVHATESE